MGKEILKYKSGFKYQTVEDYVCVTKIKGYEAKTDYITLEKEGILTIRKGYAWDGCSGPTKDDKTNMRGGLEHDAKYQLMRLGLLPEVMKSIADEELKQRILEDSEYLIRKKKWKTLNGVRWLLLRLRAWYYFQGVDHFASFACKYGSEQEVKTAP